MITGRLGNLSSIPGSSFALLTQPANIQLHESFRLLSGEQRGIYSQRDPFKTSSDQELNNSEFFVNAREETKD